MSLENVFFTGVESREAPLEISSQEGQTNNIITPTDSMKARKATTTSSLAIAPSGKRLMTKSENAITDFFENWNDILDIDIDQSEAIAAPADDSHNFLPDLDLFPEIKMEIDEDKIQEFVEVILPVVHVQEDLKKEEAVDHVWSQDSMLGSGFGTDPMACYNPMEAEGIVNEAVGLATEADEASNDLDLLNFVLDDTLHPDDPAFQEFIANDDLSTIDFGDIFGPSTSTAEIKIELPDDDDDVDYEEQPPAKRGRGRPRMPRTFPEPPRRPRGRPPTAATFVEMSDYDSSSAMSTDELKDVKYRRMRDLNNAASKRCRVNRKRKFEVMETEEEILIKRNLRLKIQVEGLEAQVAKFKAAFLANIKKNNRNNGNAATGFDLDAFVNSQIEKQH
jgi:hypothetical protein